MSVFIIKQLNQAIAAHGHASIVLIVFSAELKSVLPVVVFVPCDFFLPQTIFLSVEVSFTDAKICLFTDNSHARRV